MITNNVSIPTVAQSEVTVKTFAWMINGFQILAKTFKEAQEYYRNNCLNANS